MNLNSLEQLRTKYGGFSSWAIWDPFDRKNVSAIDENLGELNSRTVMVGLNISAPLTVPWSNFHIGRNDRKLEHAFTLGPYRGAYMTDLIKGEVEVNSATLIRRIRNGDIDIQPHLTTFKEEMLDVGASDTTLFILFGGYVSGLFGCFLGKEYPNHVSVQHYAVYGSAESWAAATLDALSHH